MHVVIPEIHFQTNRVGEVLNFLTQMARDFGTSPSARLNVVWDTTSQSQGITLHATNVSIGAMFDEVCRQTGLTHASMRDAVFVGCASNLKRIHRTPLLSGKLNCALATRLDKPTAVYYYGCGMILGDVVRIVGEQSGIPVDVDPSIRSTLEIGWESTFYEMSAGDYFWWIGILWGVEPMLDGDQVSFRRKSSKTIDND